MLRIFSIALVLTTIFFSNTAAGAATVTIRVNDASAAAGQANLEIPVSVSSVTGLGIIAADIWLAYDSSQMSSVSVSKSGTIIDTWGSMIYNGNTPGVIKIALYATEPLSAGEGILLKLFFNVKAEATAGAKNIQITKASFNGGQIAAVATNGTLTVQAGSTGNEYASTQPQPDSATQTETTTTQTTTSTPATFAIIDTTQGRAEDASASAPASTEQYSYQQQESAATVISGTEQGITGSASQTQASEDLLTTSQISYKIPQKKSGEATSAAVEMPRASAPSSADQKQPLIIEVREKNRFLIWREYALSLVPNKKVSYWDMPGNAKLPYLLFLNKQKGTIWGLVWGSTQTNVDFLVTGNDGANQSVSCELNIK